MISKKYIIILFLLFLLPDNSYAEPIIADHNAVAEFDQYKDNPEFQNAIELAKQNFHIGYGHTSHGSQITNGMSGLNTFMNNLGYPEDLFSYNNGGIGGALDLEQGDGYGSGWLDHDCGYSGWDDETRFFLDGSDPDAGTADHSDVNVIMWSWCGQVDGVNIQSHYLDNMQDLENEYPGVNFIYMTGHLEGATTGDSWFDNNNAIRSWVEGSDDKILFDFADIEKYDPDQLVNYADFSANDNCDYDSELDGSRESNWATEWQNSHTENVDWYSVSCAHSQPLNCNQKAKAFWWLMARMAGWDPDASSQSEMQNPVIADHTIVDLYDDIPQEWIDEVKKMYLNVPGESHSSGYRRGLEILEQINPDFSVVRTESGSPEPYREDALRIDRAVRSDYSGWNWGAGENRWYTWYAWDEADPSYPSSTADDIIDHITYCNENNLEISAIGFGWCWDMTWQNGAGGTIDPTHNVRWAGSSVGGPDGDMRWGLNSEDSSLTGNTVSMDTYIQATEQYIQHVADNDYDTKVFFTTGPVDGGGNSGERGYQRYLKHEHIRNWVSNNNRYLFDYADILNHNDAGEENIISWDGHDFPRIHPDNMMDFDESWNLISHTEDGDHIGEAGAVRIAKAMWWFLARMAGWDGSITPDNDGDGILNDGDESGSSSDNYCTGGETENCDDNCMNTANPDQADSDGDGRGDACDSCPNDPEKTSPGICGCGVSDIDSDGDGYPDCNDNCPSYHNSDQADHDSDGMGDVCDPDDDDDGDPDTTDCAPLDENRYTGAPEICDGTDNNCNGEIDEEACPSCTDEEITSRCDCGGSSYDSGYCCEGVYSSSECANSCNEGEINSECDCGGFSYNPGSGYCCSGNYQPINCSYSYYQDKFSDTTGIASSSEGIELHSSRISFRSGTDIDSDPDLVSIYLFEDPSNLGVDTKENNDMGIENGGFTNGNPEQSLVVPNSCSGYSLRLDGDDSICAAHSSSFDASSSHTLCWWVNPQSSSSGNNFAHASRYDTWDGDTPDVYRWSTNFDGWNRLDISNVFSQDKWVHICNVYDKNAGSKTVYINSTSSGSSSVSGMPGTSGEWCIGSYCFSDGNCGGYLNGYIYQPMWFNRSLDETEIEEIYLNTYFGAGNPQGQFTSNIIIAENNITKIELIEWTEENTDQNNNITVEISVDGGNSWMIAENHGSLNGLEKGRELVYRVSFNSPENTLYFDDINITWIESGEDACHYADSDSDGQISTIEMNTHIYNWKTNNNITLADLILVIKLWLQNL